MITTDLEDRVGVLLVENNPLDRLVIDEILRDSRFKLRYSHRGVPVNEPSFRSPDSGDRLIFEDLLGADGLAEEFKIVLLDLGLSRESEDLLASPPFRSFLASTDEVEEVFFVRWEELTRTQEIRHADSPLADATQRIPGLAYLLDHSKQSFQRVFAVVSHFTDSSNIDALRRLLAAQYGDLLLHFGQFPECATVCERFRDSLDNLVLNKSSLSHLSAVLAEALDAREEFCHKVLNLGDLANWPTLRASRRTDESTTFLNVLGNELLFPAGRPVHGPRLIVLLDSHRAIDFQVEPWRRIIEFSLGEHVEICATLTRAEQAARTTNVAVSLSPTERKGTIAATRDHFVNVVEASEAVILCHLQVTEGEFFHFRRIYPNWAQQPYVTVTALVDPPF